MEKIILAKQIGLQIRKIRKRRGLTQAEFAHRLSTAQPTIARLERGRTMLSLTSLYHIAKELNTKLVIRLIDET